MNAIAKPNPNLPRSLKLKGYVGFDKIADQYVAKFSKTGFAFNILCIGDTGIGKSTLMNTLFNTDFNLAPSTHHLPNVQLTSSTFELTEDRINLKLTVIETSGFGDQINKSNSHDPILKYINEQFELCVNNELGLKRNFDQINDTTIHLCLYFISPTGHSLKSIDLNTMKQLDKRVNIIPIIAKADTVSKNELNDFKKRIMEDLNKNCVNVYYFPINDHDLDISTLNAQINSQYPLAVIGSSDMVKIGNKITKGRHYEWGTVSVENEAHCDLAKLRKMILGTNMIDMIELTATKHYQLYRAQRLTEMGFRDGDEEESEGIVENNDDSKKANRSKNIFDMYNIMRTELNEEVQQREFEIKEEFVRKVKEKELELRESEKELNNKYNRFRQQQTEWSESLEKKQIELDNLYKQLNDRKFTFDKSRAMLANMGSTKTLSKEEKKKNKK